jgi:hypothetical protein
MAYASQISGKKDALSAVDCEKGTHFPLGYRLLPFQPQFLTSSYFTNTRFWGMLNTLFSIFVTSAVIF